MKRIHRADFTDKRRLATDLEQLAGIIHGIAIDGRVNAREMDELHRWLKEIGEPARLRPVKEITTVLKEALSDGVLSEEEQCNIQWLCEQFTGADSVFHSSVAGDLAHLEGMIAGILADGKVTDSEIAGLEAWLEEREHLAGNYPYDEIFSLLVDILADGKIDEEERILLEEFFKEFKANLGAPSGNHVWPLSVRGICAVDPAIELRNHEFSWNGPTRSRSRAEIENLILDRGGRFVPNPLETTNYLIVHDENNPCWCATVGGRFVDAAMQLRKQGVPIVLVHEIDFWDAVR